MGVFAVRLGGLVLFIGFRYYCFIRRYIKINRFIIGLNLIYGLGLVLLVIWGK